MTDASDAQKPTADRLLDLLYTGVGLGVIAVNKAQVARRNAMADDAPLAVPGLNDALDDVQKLFADPETLGTVLAWLRSEAQNLDDRLDGVEDRLDEALARLQPELPDSASRLVADLRSITADHAHQVRAFLGIEAPS